MFRTGRLGLAIQVKEPCVYRKLHPHDRRPLNMMGGCLVRPNQLGQPRTPHAVSKGENARLFEAYPRPRSGKGPQGGETIHPYAGSRTDRTDPCRHTPSARTAIM